MKFKNRSWPLIALFIAFVLGAPFLTSAASPELPNASNFDSGKTLRAVDLKALVQVLSDLRDALASLQKKVDALSSASSGSGVAACGWRQNFAMSPTPGGVPAKDLIGPAFFVLCDGPTWIRLPAVETSTGHVFLNNVGQGGHGTSGLDLTPHNRVSLYTTGVSRQGVQGGIDPDDPLGTTMRPSTTYYIYAVARAPNSTNDPKSWGLVASSRGCTSGPSATVQASYPYYTCIDWMRTDSSGAGLAFTTMKEGYRWHVANGPVVVAQGQKSRWTPLFVGSMGFGDNTGTFTFLLTSQDEAGFTALAPNTTFGNTPICSVRGSAFPQTFQQCEVTPDQGSIGLWSGGENSYWEVVGGTDGF